MLASKIKPYFLTFLAAVPLFGLAQNVISLSGKWQFAIDRNEEGKKYEWYKNFQKGDEIELPGSMTERFKGDLPTVATHWTGSLYDSSYFFNPAMASYREPGDKFSLPFFLTPPRQYAGAAWYSKEFEVPEGWKDGRISFVMERPHIKTTVWINGVEVGTDNTLCVSHVFDVTSAIRPGEKNVVTVLVSNSLKDVIVGQDSHSVTDQTQGNWNGITGAIELRHQPAVAIADCDSLPAIAVYPIVDTQEAHVAVNIVGGGLSDQPLKVIAVARPYNTQTVAQVVRAEQAFVLPAQSKSVMVELTLSGVTALWDEFDPALYRLEVELVQPEVLRRKRVVNPETVIAKAETTFGMREISCAGKDIIINGYKSIMRGTVENACFPLTGYVPTDTASWKRVFRICKEWGLNHVRFHSYCPPEAAFVAADEIGIYLQPEGPSWPNHGVKMNRKEPIDTFLIDETRRMVQQYGNHPSFTMLSAGNEPAGNWVPWATRFVNYWKAKDPRRIYTGFTVGGGWDWQPANQFHAKAGNRGLDDWKRMPGTMSDFQHAKFKGGYEFDSLQQPFICHEMGQWCVFPDFKEIEKYTGVYKAKNFEIFRDILKKQDMADRAEKFLQASGYLQKLCYKYEIEKLRRTPGYAGYQLLALNDYSGQGTALEGVLNVFWESKGYITAKEWRQYNAPVVVLMRTARFVYENDDTISVGPMISNFSAGSLSNLVCRYRLVNADGKELANGVATQKQKPGIQVAQGGLESLDSFNLSLSALNLDKPQKLNLHLSLSDAKGIVAENDWNFWVYPAGKSFKIEETGKIYVTDSLDAKALKILKKGGDVLITAGSNVSYGRDIKQYFTPVFWNTSWFKMNPPHTTGLYIEKDHPVFRSFPTDEHTDLQWWELVNRAPVMLFSDFPESFQPIVQSIDTWFISRKCGMLFEARVGKGRLMMTTMDIKNKLKDRVVARQMRKSILDYMQSDEFNPAFDVDVERVKELFTKVAPAINSYVNESPDELKPGFEKKAK